MDTEPLQQLTSFLDSWTTDESEIKSYFLRLKAHLEGLAGVKLDFVARPGITFSLRASHANQSVRSLFGMVDVIDDDPADRWLSVCFYKELVDDPEQLGDEVPGGLLGEDARCFDLSQPDEDMVRYIEQRLSEACRAAAEEPCAVVAG